MTDWTGAPCLKRNPQLFDPYTAPPNGPRLARHYAEADRLQRARNICAGCPLTGPDGPCAALGVGGRLSGVFGGLLLDVGTPVPFPPLRRSTPKVRTGRAVAPCGTAGAYRRHRRRGEPIDQACRSADAAATLIRNRKRRERYRATDGAA